MHCKNRLPNPGKPLIWIWNYKLEQGIVFKQRYKSVNLKSTPTLNRKHLVYIATRKGAIHNQGCGFGLWGRLPNGKDSENINSLKLAKQVVTDASKTHTIYRAILSVDDQTAKQYGLYKRQTWQSLVDRNISVLAQQMNMERADFCWMASMHYTKGHPHVHIMYWDNSNKVRQEFIPNERFEIIAEKVRSVSSMALKPWGETVSLYIYWNSAPWDKRG